MAPSAAVVATDCAVHRAWLPAVLTAAGTGVAATVSVTDVPISPPAQCTKRQVNQGDRTAMLRTSRPVRMSDSEAAAPVEDPSVAVVPSVPNALAPRTKTTTMTTLQKTRATTASIQRRAQMRVWSQP
jgi:hypothetical protein